jgi:exodeoxyribonuclease VII large subunit
LRQEIGREKPSREGPALEQPAPEQQARENAGAGQFDLFGLREAQPPAPAAPAPAQGAAPARAAAPAPERRVYTVGALTREVKALLEARFPDVLVEGELSNLRKPSSGHLYFTLKDEEACIDAVLFRTQARLLRFAPQNGHKLLVRGRLSLYEPQGRYQIICDSIEPLGAGALQIAFEQLKERLTKEGLFDRQRKRPLPFLPRRIAVVTSPSGAAVHDFLRVLHRRFPNLPVLIVPARMQGDGAAAEIVRAIRRAGRAPRVEVVVVARGGGSLEDLWPFNEEGVARALAACPVPTVSAVGHEVDFTIADFVADARAATPTAAAEMLARVKEELIADLAARRARLLRAWTAQIAQRQHAVAARRGGLADPRRLIGERRLRLDRLLQGLEDAAAADLGGRLAAVRALRERLDRAHPRAQLLRLRDGVRKLEERLGALVSRALTQRRQRFEGLAGRLDALSPLRVLARGYAVAFDRRGHALRSAAETKPGELLRIRLGEGSLTATVADASPERTAEPTPGTVADASSSGSTKPVSAEPARGSNERGNAGKS